MGCSKSPSPYAYSRDATSHAVNAQKVLAFAASHVVNAQKALAFAASHVLNAQQVVALAASDRGAHLYTRPVP